MANGVRGRIPQRRTVGLAPALVIVLGSLALAGCVTQSRYDQALDKATRYQRSYNDLESYQMELEGEIEALRAELALRTDAAPVEATYDARLEELRAMEERLIGISEDGEVTLVTFEGGYGYRLEDSVLFASGSAEVSPAGRQVLDRLAAEIQGKPYRRVWVRGHTDTDPINKPTTKERFPRGNLELSAARAVEVASLLARQGVVDRTRVAIMGFGETLPVAKNDTAANTQKNRRVEIFVEEAE